MSMKIIVKVLKSSHPSIKTKLTKEKKVRQLKAQN